jgi:predicted MPP superfamily phosphohydrolase
VGIPVLENRTLKIHKNGRHFWLAGLGDQWARKDNLRATLRPVWRDKNPVILLAHEPDIFPHVPSRVTLTLSGHTHGGQVRLPILGSPHVPSLYKNRFAYGHIVEKGRHLVVSSGLGMTAHPVRFGAPPEIAMVTLTAPGNTPIHGT